jgi:predicted amidophosphoribosyltransferase
MAFFSKRLPMIDLNNSVVDWLFPRRCFVCETDIGDGELCISCLSLCNACPNAGFLGESKIASLFYFEFTIKKLLKTAKYTKDNGAIYLLFKLIKQRLTESDLIGDLQTFSPAAITYVPSHWLNRIFRGVELPSLFAELIARELKLPLLNLLHRRQFLGRQALRTGKKERHQFIKGAFDLRHKNLSFDRLLLVDDIVTTRATANEATKILRTMCNEVCTITIAKTP